MTNAAAPIAPSAWGFELELTIVASTIAVPSACGTEPELVIVTSPIAPSVWSSLEPVNAAAATKHEWEAFHPLQK